MSAVTWLNRCHIGDCRDTLRRMAADGVRVQMCVTSPPYWGLRDYGTASWEGGDNGCDHRHQLGGEGSSSSKQNRSDGTQSIGYRDTCGKCGGRRIDSQLGLEATPEDYIANMVEVFRLVRDVLADDGTLWVNMGDSYSTIGSSPGGNVGSYTDSHGEKHEYVRSPYVIKKGVSKSNWDTAPLSKRNIGMVDRETRLGTIGLKPKDLVGMPWRLAFALQADGWYLRSDIIWHKPNPMPESCTDRPTKSHEYLFLLSKKPSYFYDADAVREPQSDAALIKYGDWERRGRTAKGADVGVKEFHPQKTVLPNGRNLRTVWTIATQPYSEAHFATFPQKLVEPCITAGTSERGHCPECGKRWERADFAIRFRPTCAHGFASAPDIVLDPFFGSGTVGQVAENLGRSWIGLELNPEYVKMSERRTAQMGMAL